MPAAATLHLQTVSGLEADLSDVTGLLASQEAVLAGLGQDAAAAAAAHRASLGASQRKVALLEATVASLMTRLQQAGEVAAAAAPSGPAMAGELCVILACRVLQVVGMVPGLAGCEGWQRDEMHWQERVDVATGGGVVGGHSGQPHAAAAAGGGGGGSSGSGSGRSRAGRCGVCVKCACGHCARWWTWCQGQVRHVRGGGGVRGTGKTVLVLMLVVALLETCTTKCWLCILVLDTQLLCFSCWPCCQHLELLAQSCCCCCRRTVSICC
jgi:hypothetical protein